MTRSISQSLLQRDARNTLGVFVLIAIALSGVSILLNFGLLLAYFNLANKPAPALVQLEGGRSIRVEALDSRERTPALIQTFVRDSATMLFSATGQIPATTPDGKPDRDEGIAVSGNNTGNRITTLAYFAGGALSEDFRSTFLRKLATATPQDVFTGSAQVVYRIQDVLEPQKLGDGRWKVVVVGALVAYTGSTPEGMGVPFNKEFFVRAVLPPTVSDTSTLLERQAAQVRARGLEIDDIRDYVRPNS